MHSNILAVVSTALSDLADAVRADDREGFREHSG